MLKYIRGKRKTDETKVNNDNEQHEISDIYSVSVVFIWSDVSRRNRVGKFGSGRR